MSRAAGREQRPLARQEPADRSWRPGPFAWGAVAMALLVLVGAAGFVVGRRHPSPSAVDVGFLQDMIDHHGQAIVMGKTLQTGGGSPEVEHFANEIVATQQFEVGRMLTWLEGWGLSYGEPDRRAMAWMGPGFPVDGMPGMAPEEEVQRINDLDGRPADELFVRLMIAHHRGGIAMADYEVRHGRDAAVQGLAARISRYQAVEIRELDAVRTKLRLAS